MRKKKEPKYHKEIGKNVTKIENLVTEIQRQLDALYRISNRLYEIDSEKPKKITVKRRKKLKKSR